MSPEPEHGGKRVLPIVGFEMRQHVQESNTAYLAESSKHLMILLTHGTTGICRIEGALLAPHGEGREPGFPFCFSFRSHGPTEVCGELKSLVFYFSWLSRGFHPPFRAASQCFSAQAWIFSQPCAHACAKVSTSAHVKHL